MNKTIWILVALALPLAVAQPAAADIVFTQSGSYIAASGVSYTLFDACGTNGLTQGIDSNCFGAPEHIRGLSWSLSMSGTGVVFPSVCFYSSVDFIGCEMPEVPTNAVSVSITSLTGANVGWTFSVSN